MNNYGITFKKCEGISMSKRTKHIKISGINIVSQPHSPQRYLDIFKYIHDQGLAINVHGDTMLKLVHMSPIDGRDMINGIKGQILKFSHISKDSAWVNIYQGKELNPEEIPNLPKDTYPNGVFFDFVFYPTHNVNNHKLLYISEYRDSSKNKRYSLSPNYVAVFFRNIFDNNHYFKSFDSVEVTILPSNTALEKVLSLNIVKKLEIFIKAPNPDDFAALESKMLRRMEEINVSTITETYRYDGDSIMPDEEILNDAKVALNNGHVKTEGKDENGKSVKRSTVNIPLRDVVKLDTDRPEAARFALQNYQFSNDER